MIIRNNNWVDHYMDNQDFDQYGADDEEDIGAPDITDFDIVQPDM